jgi:hypothetical protein
VRGEQSFWTAPPPRGIIHLDASAQQEELAELTEQQRNLVQQCPVNPSNLWIPNRSKSTCSSHANSTGRQASHQDNGSGPPSTPSFQVAEGIRRSQEALRRDLPKLLENKKLLNRWVAYHGDERVGLARDSDTLLRECIKRGYESNEYYIGWINPCELVEDEEEDLRPQHCGCDDSPSDP